MMDRKQKLEAYLHSRDYIPLKLKELMIVLDVPEEDWEELKRLLELLELEGKISVSKKGKYLPCDTSASVTGTLICHAKGFFGFVIPDEGEAGDIYVKGTQMGEAFHKDRVLVQIDSPQGKTSRREGHVVRVLERGLNQMIGVVEKQKNEVYRIRPDDPRFYEKIRVKPEDMLGAVIGERVAVQITRYEKGTKAFGRVVKLLGKADSLKSCIEAVIEAHGLKQEFEENTLVQSKQISVRIPAEDIKGRLDLRGQIIFTIDGNDAKDFDDAVGIELLENGNYRLGVHIADVSHYVTEYSPLDNEAYERATSVYLADRVIPMLPEELSNGICSLRPKEDRLTLSVFMEIDPQGMVTNHSIHKSIIRSVERMTYENVNVLLANEDEALFLRYEYLMEPLRHMEKLAALLREKRTRRGAIQFEFPETRVRVNEKGKPVSVTKEERGISNKMIEEFMLAANETVAEFAFWSELPFVYRVHEAPSLEKITAFNGFLQHFNLGLKGKIDKDNPVKPKALEQIMDAVRDTPEERIVARTMLQSLMKAEYRPANTGHFGLAAKYYCHFTSPIRRYPDLVIHRILKEFLTGGLSEERAAALSIFVRGASKQSSDQEVSAETAERDVDDLMKTYYMTQFIGQEFEGVISGVTGFGMFVELENTVEGLIRLENMTDDYYVYDEINLTLTGERHQIKYRIGDPVTVMLVRTDILTRQIDFILSENASKKLLKKFSERPERPGEKKEEPQKKKYYKRRKKHK